MTLQTIFQTKKNPLNMLQYITAIVEDVKISVCLAAIEILFTVLIE